MEAQEKTFGCHATIARNRAPNPSPENVKSLGHQDKSMRERGNLGRKPTITKIFG